MIRLPRLLLPVILLSLAGCDRFKTHAEDAASPQRIVCIGQAYNEMI